MRAAAMPAGARERGIAMGRIGARWIVAVETCLALALGAFHVGGKSLWFDEAFTAHLVGRDPGTFWHLVSGPQVNMSLYYLLLRPWTGALGSNEAILRLPSVLAFALTVPALFMLGRRLRDARTGVVAGLLFALSPFALHYAQEARSYALVCLLATTASYALVRAVEPGGHSRRWWAAWVLAAALLAYGHVLGLAVVAGHVVAVVAQQDRRRLLVPLSASLAGLAVLLVPLAFAYSRGAASEGLMTAPPTSAHTVYDVALGLAGGSRAALAGLAVLAGIGIFTVRRSLAGATVIGWAVGTPAVLLTASLLVRPLMVDRYFIAALPGVLLLAATGITSLRLRTAATASLIAGVAVSAIGIVAWYQRPATEDWRSAAAYLTAAAGSGDAVIFDEPIGRTPFFYYAPGPAVAHLREQIDLEVSRNPAVLLPSVATFDRVWIVRSHAANPHRPLAAVERWLVGRDRVAAARSWPGVEVVLLVAPEG